MPATKLITVVIPVLDRQDTIIRTLESIAAQTLLPSRVIVVDNGSSDLTVPRVTEWCARQPDGGLDVTLISEPRRGAAAARNRGLREVSTDYVMFFDSDDEMRPRHIERIARALEAEPGLDLACWDIAILDDDNWQTVKSVNDTIPLRGHLFHGLLATQRFVVRTSLARSAGGWDETLSALDDLEFGTRLLLSGPVFRKLHGEPLVVQHTTPGSLSSALAEAPRAVDHIEARVAESDEPLQLLWVRALRAITAARMRRGGLAAEGRTQLHTALQGLSWRQRMAIRLAYRAVAATGHGGAAIAGYAFRPKRKKR